jgi:hypothetical protein
MSIKNRVATIERKTNIKPYPQIDAFYRTEDQSLEEVMARQGKSMADYSDPSVRHFLEVVYVSVKPQGQAA